MSAREPDIREVARIEALCTVDGDDAATEAFLDRCVPGSTWTAKIRTAEVVATVLSRAPLGTFAESVCTCVKLRLARSVPLYSDLGNAERIAVDRAIRRLVEDGHVEKLGRGSYRLTEPLLGDYLNNYLNVRA